MSAQINFKKGSVEMLLLHVLSCKGDCYGYQLSQLIKKSSGGELDFPVGSLYPALYNMKNVFFMILKPPFASWMQNILLTRCCAGSWVVPKI